MKMLLGKYYNFFTWGNGENTCVEFTILIVAFVAMTIFEIVYRKKNHRSFFF